LRRDDETLHALLYLRKGKGATLKKFVESRPLRRAFGVEDDDAQRAYDQMIRGLELLGDEQHARAIKNALNLHGSTELLAGRRDRFASSVGKSVSTVRDWEDAGLDELLLVLLADAKMPAPPDPSAIFFDRRVDAYYVDWRWRRTRHEFDLLIRKGPYAFYRYGSNQTTELVDVQGARLETYVENPGGQVIYRLHFDNQMNRGERVRFSFVEKRRDDLPVPDLTLDYDWMSQAFHTPARHLQITAHFDGPRPDLVHRFTQLHDWERLAALDSDDTIPVSENGDVTASFRDLHSGLHSGFSWRRPVS
jgi:hypothetical protein